MIIILVGFKVCEQCIVRSLLFHVKMCEISFHETKINVNVLEKLNYKKLQVKFMVREKAYCFVF